MGFVGLPSLVLLTALVFPAIPAVKFPNDIDGQPEIECGDMSVKISVKTTNGVPSRLYAKGHFADSGCTFEKTNSGSFIIGGCGMNRQRQLEPRGISYGLVVVVQLHPMFVTKVDRAYSIRCFYMEAEKTVTSMLDVSMISTQAVTGGAPMPVCNYEIHADSPNGPAVRYARVGDKVWHTWTCPSPTYGILVHSCVVTDGQGNDFKVIDEKGCSMDQYVMRTPEYSTDLTRVQQETHVFKFADKTAVMFNCQIKLCQKTDGGCEGVSPPICGGTSSPTGQVEQSSSESPSNDTTHTPLVNQTVASDLEATTSRAQQPTITVKVLDAVRNETEIISSANQTSALMNGTFPMPHGFPSSESLSSNNILVNNTFFSEGENASIIIANKTTPRPTILPHILENVTETILNNRTLVVMHNAEIGSVPPQLPNQVNVTSENSTTGATFNNTPIPILDSSTRGIEFFNISVHEGGNFSALINESKLSLYNMTNAEGFLVLSKSGHRNLSWTHEGVDVVTEVASGEGSGYWETNDVQVNDTLDDLVHQNKTLPSNRTTVSPLTLANATIIVVGASDDGRGRRNVLTPLLDATNELIKQGRADVPGRRLKDEPYDRLPDIETDVSQLMWVLEPEEGSVKDKEEGEHGHQGKDPLRALNREGDGDEEWRRMQVLSGRVCLSHKTMLAILMPLLAMMILTIAVVILCLRRLRTQTKTTHFHHPFPFNYLYKDS